MKIISKKTEDMLNEKGKGCENLSKIQKKYKIVRFL